MKHKNETSISLNRKPEPVKWYLKPIMRIGTELFLAGNKFTLKKINCENLKWPYLIISSHASFMDFVVNCKATRPYNTTYIASIEEFVGREELLRGVGCFPKRKYTQDARIAKNTLYAIKKLHNSVTIYPEARYSLIGINERIDKAMGKLAKVANVPVVVMICHGDFIHQPHYNQTRTFKIPLETELKCIVTQEEVATLTADEIQKRIEENFVYDDYQYQFDNHIENKSKYRADNLHRILYKCPHCGKDYSMTSHYTKLWCQECHEEYEMDVYGQLHNKNGNTIFHHVPDWYRWERQEVEKEVKNGTYHFECKVRLEHLSNSKVGFVPLGEVNFVQDYQGLHLEGTLDDGSPFKFDNPSINTPSIHIDYNFKKKGVKKQGQALDINNEQDTYFIYPLVDECVVCKIHFATEALYDLAKEKEDKR